MGNPTDSTAVSIDVTSDIPSSAKPPPPKATGAVQTYSADPPTGVRHYLGDAGRKGNDTEWGFQMRKPQRGRAQRKDSKGTDSTGKDRKGKSDTENGEDLEEGS